MIRKEGINRKTYESIARELGVEAGAIFALITVESKGKFEIGNGKIPILFEKHWFYKLIKKKYGKKRAKLEMKINPNICNRKSGGYGKESAQYSRLARAIKINNEIAHQSTSFGAFQIMGLNFKLCGYKSAVEMSDAYHESPRVEQIHGFINFVKDFHDGKLLLALRAKKWGEVARRYNGKGYRKNRYAKKLKRSYREWIEA